MKKLLLALSLVALGFLVASGLSENVFASWKGYQKEYARPLAERAEDPARKREALATAVELRQFVVPDLHVIDRHFKDPQGIVPGSLMKPDYPTEEEASALTSYMLSLQAGRELPDRAVARDGHRLLSQEYDQGKQEGRMLYDLLCRDCHGEGTFGTYDKSLGRFVPAIRNPAFLRMVDREFLRANIMSGRPGTLMPDFGGAMTDADLAKLLEYLAGSERIPERRPDSYEKLPVGDAKRGGSIFARQCAGCHDPGEKGQVAPTLSSRSFQEKASDAMILRTIAEGRPGTAMVAFVGAEGTGFTGGELADLLAYLRTLHPRRK